MELSRILVVIPARKGSKGLPGKNVKLLAGKPLIAYTIEAALGVFPQSQICISTDDPSVIEVAKGYGLEVPFVRPNELATDTAGMQDVLLHAYQFYQKRGDIYDSICLLQPTSPFRNSAHVSAAFQSYAQEIIVDMMVSVTVSKANPYFNLMEAQPNGLLKKSKEAPFVSRQQAPTVYELNGAIYFISTKAICSKPISQFESISKYVMNKADSIDIDDQSDWDYAAFLLGQKEL